MFDAMVNFVRRNPLTVLLIVLLAVCAPSLLRGIASFIVFLIVGFVLLVLLLAVLVRWRIYKMQRQMEAKLRQGGGAASQGGFYTFYGNMGGRRQQQGRSAANNEGDVRVHQTGGKPEKRISEDVGDYVEFEETKE